jgi:hypothetical protein
MKSRCVVRWKEINQLIRLSGMWHHTLCVTTFWGLSHCYAFTLVSCSAYSSTLKMEAICSSETSVDIQQITQRYIPEDSTLHNYTCCFISKSLLLKGKNKIILGAWEQCLGVGLRSEIIQGAAEITAGFTTTAQALVVQGVPDLCPWVALALPFKSPSWHGAVNIVHTLLKCI